uniref:threonine--tRNA ligase n=1 Tax=Aceria tosichella TaxID=561515 RepID=A0A6G1S5E4_9ACAR
MADDSKTQAPATGPSAAGDHEIERPNDHRKIGREQNLFMFDGEYAPGSGFFLPRGAYIYNTLMEYLRQEYRKRRYQEVITPNMFNCTLWEKSGHWAHYAENMFTVELSEHEKHSWKPMNCPSHCRIFDSTVRSYRELPLRLADFGVLHRNEASGALSGLTRVRRFQQDDAHLFCAPEHIEQEIKNSIDFMRDVYDNFDFTFSLCLSTRPESYMGELSLWDDAEASLKKVLDNTKLEWTLNEGDGAFYGPKIDITIRDSTGKPHQCATIQLDFQLPIRFDLKYVKPDRTFGRPIIVHRAIFGSIERFIAILCENFAGHWPFWLSPIQAQIVTVNDKLNDYALGVEDRFIMAGFNVECELDPTLTLNKKIRNAEVSKYNFIMVVGHKELEADSVTMRITVDKKTHQIFAKVDRVIELFKEFKEKRVKNADREFLAAFS